MAAGGARGSKEIIQEVINFYKVNRNGYPYELIYKLTELYQVIEDTYSVSTITELQDAIDDIGTGAGTIFIASGTYTVDTTIDIDNCGSLVIYGHGDNTILQAAAGTRIFNITCVDSCVIKTLKLDITNYNALAPNTEAVYIAETNNNVVALQDVTIDGDGSYGYGVEITSNNCDITQCNITDCKVGVYINSSNRHTINENTITGHADYGIYVSSGSYLNISNNTCSTCSDYGIYLNTATYSTVAGNICNSNTETGIYCDAATNCTISSNSCSSNSRNGIYLTGSSYNTISSNTLNSNDSDTAAATAGLHITANSDFNTITGNSVNNNNNIGTGTGFGIFIASATCDENVVASNNANGNDIDYKDSGTDTTVEYYVQDESELQDAIDSIGTKSGIINIDTSFTVSTTIDINGNGSYIIQGEGTNSTLTISGDISCFDISSARQVVLKNFKIDATGYTAAAVNEEIIKIAEVSDNLIILDNVIIEGDGSNGQGIVLDSANIRVENCTISSTNVGIEVLKNNCILRGNIIDSCNTYGIELYSVSYCLLLANISNNNTRGIMVEDATYNTITGNVASSNTYGFYLNSDTDSNVLVGNTATSNTTDGIFLYEADYNILLGNNVLSNSVNGIHLNIASSNHLSDNVIKDNDSNVAAATAGLYIEGNSDTNVIIGNSLLNNNNGGVGTGYGVYIKDNTGDRNIIQGNTISGNDNDWNDGGTNTQMEYYCSDARQIQNAIDSIAAKTGTIKIASGTIDLSATINIDGGGNYTIIGQGEDTILDCNGDRTCFNITAADYCLIKNLKIDCADLTTATKAVISVNEASDNQVFIENVIIDGDTNNGYGIHIQSDYVSIKNCEILEVNYGIYNAGNYATIISNLINSCAKDGIYLTGATYTNINGNRCYSNTENGISLNNTSTYNMLSGNRVNGNSLNGIYIDNSDYNSITANFCISNASNTSSNTGGIILDNTADNNAISDNMSYNNSNAGSGYAYAIAILDFSATGNTFSNNYVDDTYIYVQYGFEDAKPLEQVAFPQQHGTIFWKPDGTKLWTADYDTCWIREYAVSPAFDLSTISLNDSVCLVECSENEGIWFNSTGSKMFVSDFQNFIYEYDLGTNWDSSTRVYNGNNSGNLATDISHFWMNSDGTKLYLADGTNGVIRQYSLGTAWDITTIAVVNNSGALVGVTTCDGVWLDDTGKKIWILVDQNTNPHIEQWTLGTAWDITTMSDDGIEIYPSVYNLFSLAFRPDGMMFYEVGLDDVTEHLLGFQATFNKLKDDSKPQLGGDINLADYYIRDAQYNKILHATGGKIDELANISAAVTMESTLTVQGQATVDGLLPEADVSDDLGSATKTWRDLYVQNIKDDEGNTVISTGDYGFEVEKTYYVSSESELWAAITDIEDNNYAARVVITASFSVSGVTVSNASCSIIFEGVGMDTTISTSGTDEAFDIDAIGQCVIQNLTIDCTSHTHRSDQAILVDGGDKVTIRNVKFIGDGSNSEGIEVNVDNVHITNCQFYNVDTGILLSNSADYCSIIGCTFYSSARGIDNNGADYCTITGNVIYSCAYGIILNTAANYNSIGGNVISNNTVHGIYIDGNSDYNIMAGNTITGNTTTGIRVDQADCTGNVIGNTIFQGNGTDITDNGTSTNYGARYS